jgi:hypothetical protein
VLKKIYKGLPQRNAGANDYKEFINNDLYPVQIRVFASLWHKVFFFVAGSIINLENEK